MDLVNICTMLANFSKPTDKKPALLGNIRYLLGDIQGVRTQRQEFKLPEDLQTFEISNFQFNLLVQYGGKGVSEHFRITYKSIVLSPQTMKMVVI